MEEEGDETGAKGAGGHFFVVSLHYVDEAKPL